MKIRILLAEDDEEQLEALANRLESARNCEVERAITIEEAITIFNNNKGNIDLIIADMHFGKQNSKGGLRLIEEIRKKQSGYIPIIVLTGFGDIKNTIECMEAGAFSYVFKGGEDDSTFNILNQTISRALEQRRLGMLEHGMVLAICKMVDSHEPYTGGHSERVGDYAKIIAEAANLSEEQRVMCWYAGLVHDLGKVGVDAEVLARPAKLSPVLMASIHHHPVEGFRILNAVGANPDVARAVLEHHKRIDGSGYPEFHAIFKKDKALSPIGQILGIADSFDAMTTPRPYIGRLSKHTLSQALKELEQDAKDNKYDNGYVACLENTMPKIWDIFKQHVNQGRLSGDLFERNCQDPPPGVSII